MQAAPGLTPFTFIDLGHVTNMVTGRLELGDNLLPGQGGTSTKYTAVAGEEHRPDVLLRNAHASTTSNAAQAAAADPRPAWCLAA